MQNRVNKILIANDIDRTASLVIQGASQNLAEGEAFVVDKNKNLLAAGATVADTDIIYVGIGTDVTFDYRLPDGTAVTAEREVKFSAPIQGSLVKSYKGLSADNAATERTSTIDIESSAFTPVTATEYVLRVVYKDIPEHPGQFTDTFRVTSTSATPADLVDLFVTEINKLGPSGRAESRVIASEDGSADLLLTGRVIPYNETSEEIDEYRQVDFTTILFSDNFGVCAITYGTEAHPGNGNPKIVRDREKFAQSYEGITNRIHFPVVKPLQSVSMTTWYDSIIIENGIDFVSADMEYVKETQVTTEIYLPANALQTADILAVLNPWMASVNQIAVTV